MAPHWTYQPSEELDLSMVERLKRYPREPDMIVYLLRSAAALGLRSWLRAYLGLRIHGRENLPREGSFILVGNHTSHLDALCMLSALPLAQLHRAFPAAAADLIFESLARSSFSALFLNAIPFQRKGGSSASLALCRGLLANPGNILLLFPEGTRTATGDLGPFKPGIGLLAGGTPIPVIPCHLRGAFEAWPRTARFPRPGKLDLVIGTPRTYPHTEATREGALEVAQDLREAVRVLGLTR